MSRVVCASWVVPGEGEPLADGAVAVDDAGTVLALGPAADVRAAHPGARVEVLRGVLIPGLVNAHTHLEQSWLRGRVAGGAGHVAWSTARDALQRAADPDEVDAAMARACDDLVACGTAAVGDFARVAGGGEALARRGLGAVVFRELEGGTLDGLEGVLLHAEGDVGAPRGWRSALAAATLCTTTVALLRAARARARAAGALMALHLAEHPGERAWLRERAGPCRELVSRAGVEPDALPRGGSPTEAADALGLLAPDVLAVHLGDARRVELDVLAARGVRVVLCPRASLYVQTLLPPLLDALAAGLRPALGTDSLAATTSLDVLAEAAALRARFPGVAPRTLLAMASAWGADALGLAHLGRIAPGTRPGLVAVDAAAAPVRDPFVHVLASAATQRRWVVRPGTARD